MDGVWFDFLHSYQNYNLILSEVEIPPAEPKTNFVDLPGGDGSVDLTEAQGEVKFKDRDCKFTFTVAQEDDFEEKKTQISNDLNGKRCKVRLDKDPDYYWDGRLSVDSYASNKNVHSIVIGGKFAPYKLKKDITTIKVAADGGSAVLTFDGDWRGLESASKSDEFGWGYSMYRFYHVDVTQEIINAGVTVTVDGRTMHFTNDNSLFDDRLELVDDSYVRLTSSTLGIELFFVDTPGCVIDGITIPSVGIWGYAYPFSLTIEGVYFENETKSIITLSNGRKPVIPIITTLADTIIEFDGNTYELGAGKQKVLDIRFTEGEYQFYVTSSKDVTFEYQEGEL